MAAGSVPDTIPTAPAGALTPLTPSASGPFPGAPPPRRQTGITVLAVLAVVYTLYFGHAFFVPVCFALVLNFLLSPAVRWARQHLHLPAAVTAAVLILSLTGAVGGSVYELAGPARGWLASAPQTLSRAGAKLHTILKPVEQVSRTAEQVEKVSNVTGAQTPKQQVVVAGPSIGARLFGTTQSIVGALLEVLVLAFFLLSAGDLFLQKTIKITHGPESGRTAVEIARAAEHSISRYLVTSAVMNLGEGVVVGLVMWVVGMPNPFLWGALVTVMEFVPYIGALTIIAVLTIASLTVFPNVGHAMLIPGSFIIINLLQGNLVGPLVMGHRLSLNPVAIFLNVALWWELWGIAGAFLAVPMLATFKIVCDHIPSLTAIGEFLGERDETERRLAVRVEP
jgi:predicted PurR-regulated permease PerM